jgi:hypothetical protein
MTISLAVRSPLPRATAQDSPRSAATLLIAALGITAGSASATVVRPSASAAAGSSQPPHGAVVITEPFGLNCASEADVEAGDGITYGEDWDYVPGRPGGHEGGVRRVYDSAWLFHGGSNQDLPLYKEDRIGHQAYHFAVEPGARYELTLRLWEPIHHGPEARSFDLLIDGVPAWSGIDPYALVGPVRSLGMRRIVQATDDLLDIELLPVADQPLLSGIALRPVDTPPEERLDEVQLLRAQPTYHGAFLSWKYPDRTHLDGYIITARRTEPPHLAETWRTYKEWTQAPAGDDLEYLVAPMDAWGHRGRLAVTAGSDSLRIEDSPLPWFTLEIDPRDLRTMEAALPQKPFFPATLTFGGDRCSGRLSFRGESTLLEPKKSYRFRIDDGALIESSRKVNLAASFTDASMIREALAYSLMQLCGIEPYRARLSRLDRNGRYQGLLAWVEATDEAYLERIELDPGAHAYEVHCRLEPADSLADYLACYSNINRPNWYRDDLIGLIQELDQTPQQDLELWFHSHFAIDQLLDWYAAQVITANDDFAGRNYILYHDPATRLWSVLPVDSDEILYRPKAAADYGSRWSPNRAGQSNILVNRLLTVPALQRRLFRRMRAILDGPYADHADASIDSLAGLVIADGTIDPYKRNRETNSAFVSAVDWLRDAVSARPNHLRSSIDDLIYPAAAALSLNELIFHAGSDTAADTLAQVEFQYRGVNRGHFRNLWLSRDLHDPHGFWVGTLELREAQAKVIDLPPSFGDANWIALYADMGGQPELIDSTSILPYPTSFGRLPDGYGPFRPLPVATPAQANQGDTLLTLNASPRDPIIHADAPLIYDVTILCGAHPLPPSTLEIQLFTEGGIQLNPEPARTTFVSALEPGETWSRTIEFAQPAIAPGRIDAEFRLWQSLLRRLATTRATLYYDAGPLPQITINELCADNRWGPADGAGEHEDWVELYNGSAAPVLLDDYYLTDDFTAAPLRWRLPSDLRISPGTQITFWLDGQPEQGPDHANFRLSRLGESLSLVHLVDDTPQRVDWILFGAQPTDWSYGRYPDGRPSWEVFPDPSYAAPNQDPDPDAY